MNTVSIYMRPLRAICNKAIFIDLVDQSWYPFFKYKIKKGKTLPKTLNIEEMKRYFALNLPHILSTKATQLVSLCSCCVV
jgi:hypothetical protein